MISDASYNLSFLCATFKILFQFVNYHSFFKTDNDTHYETHAHFHKGMREEKYNLSHSRVDEEVSFFFKLRSIHQESKKNNRKHCRTSSVFSNEES